MICEKCGSSAISYYRQVISNGKTVVTARCERGHSPIKGRPFFPVAGFDLAKLPRLPEQDEKQPTLFDTPKKEIVYQEVDLVEWKRSIGRKYLEAKHGNR
jgi:hypothetical protein